MLGETRGNVAYVTEERRQQQHNKEIKPRMESIYGNSDYCEGKHCGACNIYPCLSPVGPILNAGHPTLDDIVKKMENPFNRTDDEIKKMILNSIQETSLALKEGHDRLLKELDDIREIKDYNEPN